MSDDNTQLPTEQQVQAQPAAPQPAAPQPAPQKRAQPAPARPQPSNAALPPAPPLTAPRRFDPQAAKDKPALLPRTIAEMKAGREALAARQPKPSE